MAQFRFAAMSFLVVGLISSGCDKTAETAELATCEQVARLALDSPAGFKVTGSEIDETSEGETVLLEVDYTDAAGNAAHTREKCWFGGYGEKKPLKRLYVERDDKFIAVPASELEEYKKQIAG